MKCCTGISRLEHDGAESEKVVLCVRFPQSLSLESRLHGRTLVVWTITTPKPKQVQRIPPRELTPSDKQFHNSVGEYRTKDEWRALEVLDG